MTRDVVWQVDAGTLLSSLELEQGMMLQLLPDHFLGLLGPGHVCGNMLDVHIVLPPMPWICRKRSQNNRIDIFVDGSFQQPIPLMQR
jgi:hypothetical protein